MPVLMATNSAMEVCVLIVDCRLEYQLMRAVNKHEKTSTRPSYKLISYMITIKKYS